MYKIPKLLKYEHSSVSLYPKKHKKLRKTDRNDINVLEEKLESLTAFPLMTKR